MERDFQSLLDMLQSAQIATGYIARWSRQDLETDMQLQDAIVLRLLIICEAARRISEETQQSLPTVPWSAINGMRNLLVHEYDEIDLDIVWDTLQISLPVLIAELENVVPPKE